MKLDVYVQERLIGTLEQTDITEYIFNYLPDAPPELAVSLLMPVRTKSWVSPFLHPVFQISLPEGALRAIIERVFAKNFERFGDMELLAIAGENLVGQIQAVPAGEKPAKRTARDSLSNLLSADMKVLVDHYLGGEHVHQSGVSGGLPKFLSSSPIGAEGLRTTLPFNQWIVKLNGPDHPHIVLLEHFGMMAAREMGLPTAEIMLSDDRNRLLVKRFDVDDEGRQLGFEDMCALLGMPARDKFSGSVERVIKTIRALIPGIGGHESTDLFYGQYLLAAAMRNGDAHLKNFGLVYEPGKVPRLAPVFDMLTMATYAPRTPAGDALDGMALSLGGTKRWPGANDFEMLAKVCGVPPKRQDYWKARLSNALQKTADAVIALQRDDAVEGFGPLAGRMVELWSFGLRELNKTKADALANVSAEINRLSPAQKNSTPSRRRPLMDSM